MNLQNLEYFLTVADLKSITKAAEKMGISQQAISGQITRLEQELNCRLFERKKELELTYAGKLLQKSAVQMLEIQDQTQRMINDAADNRRGELRIGISHSRGQAILPQVLPDFAKRFPHVELTLVEASTRELEDALEKGKIDVMIGFLPFQAEDSETRLMMYDRMFLVAPVELLREKFGDAMQERCEQYMICQDLTIFEGLPYVMLLEGDRIRTIVDSELKKKNLSPDISIETRNIQTAFSLTAAGMGLTVCPELYLNSPHLPSGDPNSEMRKQVVVLPFPDGGMPDRIGIGWNKTRYQSTFTRAFINDCLTKLGK